MLLWIAHQDIFFSVHRLIAFARSINTLLHAAYCPLINAVEISAILVKRCAKRAVLLEDLYTVQWGNHNAEKNRKQPRNQSKQNRTKNQQRTKTQQKPNAGMWIAHQEAIFPHPLSTSAISIWQTTFPDSYLSY